jgi:hypothetical protein
MEHSDPPTASRRTGAQDDSPLEKTSGQGSSSALAKLVAMERRRASLQPADERPQFFMASQTS